MGPAALHQPQVRIRRPVWSRLSSHRLQLRIQRQARDQQAPRMQTRWSRLPETGCTPPTVGEDPAPVWPCLSTHLLPLRSGGKLGTSRLHYADVVEVAEARQLRGRRRGGRGSGGLWLFEGSVRSEAEKTKISFQTPNNKQRRHSKQRSLWQHLLSRPGSLPPPRTHSST
jgi:hypothetical protein